MTAIIVDLVECVLALLAIFGFEFIPSTSSSESKRHDQEHIGEFLSLWIVWMITGARFITSLLATLIWVDRKYIAILLTLTLLASLFLIACLYSMARIGPVRMNSAIGVIKFSIRVIPFVFIVLTIMLHGVFIPGLVEAEH